MSEHERLREVILDLERTRVRERELRLESESLLAGLRVLSLADEPQAMFEKLLDVVQGCLEAEAAALFRFSASDGLEPVAATQPFLAELGEQAHELARRLRGDQPLALFDLSKLGEWDAMPVPVRERVRSALCVPLREYGQDALIVCTHSERGHFSQKHVKLSRRFALLAAQALVNVELRMIVRQRERLFSIASDMLAITNYKGQFRQLNDAWSRTLGWSMDELVTADVVDKLVHPAHQGAVREALERMASGDSQAEGLELRCATRDGFYRWMRWSLTAYSEEQLVYVIAQDITDSKRVEALRRKLMTKMERELAGAQTMQGLLLQHREISGPCTVEIVYRQATYGGGDWFYVDQVGDFLLFVIADVLGHGTPAAMLAAFGRGYMTGLSAATRLVDSRASVLRPALLLKYLNDAIHDATRGVSGMTCFAAVIDTRRGTLSYANGGHMCPLIAPSVGHGRNTSIRTLRSLAGVSARIGFESDAEYRQQETTLAIGDKLVLFTDGLIESRNTLGEPFGQSRCMRVVARYRRGKPHEMVVELQRALAEHVGSDNLDDDFMVAVIQYGEAPEDT